MKFCPVSSEDLINLARMEKNLFHEDAFGVFVLLHYLQNHLFFEKIVENGDQIIGFGIITKFNLDILNPNEIKILSSFNIQPKKVAHLVDFAIREEFWNLGYGSHLLFHLFEQLKKTKYKQLYLEVDSNNSRAIRFYSNHSFSSIGIIQSYYHNGNDAIIMVHQLENLS